MYYVQTMRFTGLGLVRTMVDVDILRFAPRCSPPPPSVCQQLYYCVLFLSGIGMLVKFPSLATSRVYLETPFHLPAPDLEHHLSEQS